VGSGAIPEQTSHWHAIGSSQLILGEEYDMSLMVLESGAVILTLLVGWEMRRQQLAWRSVLIRSLILLGILTAMIAMWRGR
jgi:hypothetical protein